MLTKILERIEERLEAVGLDATNASRLADLGDDGIRNLRRAVKAKGRAGVNLTTLLKLAPVLKTSPSWLIDGIDFKDLPASSTRLWCHMKDVIATNDQGLQDRVADFAEDQLSRYQKSRLTAAKQES